MLTFSAAMNTINLEEFEAMAADFLNVNEVKLYNTSNIQDVNKLMTATSKESKYTQEQIRRLIQYSDAIGITSDGKETKLYKIGVLSKDQIKIYDTKTIRLYNTV